MQTPTARLKQAFTALRNNTGLPFELDRHEGYRVSLRGRNMSPRLPLNAFIIWIEAYIDGWNDSRRVR